MADTLRRFKALFKELDATHCSTKRLSEVYCSDIIFVDPFHRIQGLNQLYKYFTGMYENVISCNFQFYSETVNDQQAWTNWEMLLRHKRLKQGKEFSISGCTYVEIQAQKIRFHRDFFDAGELLYENIPLLGPTIKLIKKGV